MPAPAGRARCCPCCAAPHPVLAEPGVEVDPTDPRTRRSWPPTCWPPRTSRPGCVGLAAQQVGVAARRVQRRRQRSPQDPHLPRPVRPVQRRGASSATRRERGREGCMSVPDFTGDVSRARRLVVRGQLPGTGEWVEIATDAFEAVAAAARDRPHRRAAVPRPGRRPPRHPPAPRPIGNLTPVPVAQRQRQAT